MLPTALQTTLMPDDTLVRLAAPDYNFAFKQIPPIQFLLSIEDRLDPMWLRAALDVVLEDYSVLRGRLEVGSGDEAFIRVPPHRRDSIPVRVEEMESPLDPSSIEPGFERIDEASRGPGGPLARVRIGQSRRSTCLGISVAHAVGDGRSLFAFVDAWARAYSGRAYPIPTFDRDALRVESTDDEEPVTEGYVERATGYLYRQADYPPSGPLVRDRLVFSAAEVAAMRAEAHARDLTLHDALTAHAWRAFDAYAPRRDPGIHTLRCPVDYRRHLPALGSEFYGSVLRDAVMELDAGQFAAASPAQLARIVHRGVRTIDGEAVSRLLRCYERLRREGGPGAFARLVAPGLIVTNFSRTRVTELDFAGAKPDYVLNLSISTRTANIVPQRDGLEIQILRRTEPLWDTSS
jgi:hypothetical protein